MTFFYQKLPVAPSIRATIAFSVSYIQSSMRGERPFPMMGIYTAYPKINIEKRCSYVRYGQLHNENLHSILRLTGYRTTICELSGSDTVNCKGRFYIQDYIPKDIFILVVFDYILTSVIMLSTSSFLYSLSISLPLSSCSVHLRSFTL